MWGVPTEKSEEPKPINLRHRSLIPADPRKRRTENSRRPGNESLFFDPRRIVDSYRFNVTPVA